MSSTLARQFCELIGQNCGKQKFIGDITDSRGSDLLATPTSSLPRERPDVLDGQLQDHPAPVVYWITPQHVTVYVIE